MRVLPLLLPALLAPAAWCLESGAGPPCHDDVDSMASDGSQAVVIIGQAFADCTTTNKATCSDDIVKLLDSLDTSAYDVANALGDCAHVGADCVGSLKSIGDTIGAFKPVARKILGDCGDEPPSKECVADVFEFLADGVQLEHAVFNATDACHKVHRAWIPAGSLPLAVWSLAKELKATKFGAGPANDTCLDDVKGVAESGAELVRSMVEAAGDCNKEDRAACSGEIGAIVDGLESEQRRVAQAVGDCEHVGVDCVNALKNVAASIDDFKPAATHMATDCGGSQKSTVKCVADSAVLVTDAALLGASIAQASKACQSPSAPAVGAEIVV